MKFISIDYYTSGDSDQRFHKRDSSILHQKKKRRVQKKAEGNNLKRIPKEMIYSCGRR